MSKKQHIEAMIQEHRSQEAAVCAAGIDLLTEVGDDCMETIAKKGKKLPVDLQRGIAYTYAYNRMLLLTQLAYYVEHFQEL